MNWPPGRWTRQPGLGGVDIHLIHRETRAGYKAGALAAGLARARRS